MERKDVFSWVKEVYGTEPDYPWNDWNAVLRHKGNNNVKCDPVLIGSLREQSGFFPAYHMNKENWISILLDGSVPEDVIKNLINMSYELTRF